MYTIAIDRHIWSFNEIENMILMVEGQGVNDKKFMKEEMMDMIVK